MTRLHLALCIAAAALVACADSDDPSAPDTTPDDTGSDVTPDDTVDGGDPYVVPELSFVPITLDGTREIVTEMRFIPGASEFLMLEKNGVIAHYALDGDETTLLGEFTVGLVSTALDCGLLSLAFDPDFETNQLIYVGLCTSASSSGVFRYTFTPDDYAAIDATGVEILSVAESRTSNPWHNVGSIGFDDTGALWALFGEKTVTENGQDPTNLLGTMVRIVPSREPGTGGYTIPEDNPFYGADWARNEIYAWGLRSPWRGLRDHRGWYWIGDVGADSAEEVNIATEPGMNFGWGRAEGPCRRDCDGLTDPVAWFGHGDDDDYAVDDPDAEPAVQRSVWVGVEYQDRGNDPYDGALTNRVLFGDFCLGFVRLLEVDDEGTLVRDVHVGHQGQLSGWDQAPDGFIYTVSFGACETRNLDPPPPSILYRVVRSN